MPAARLSQRLEMELENRPMSGRGMTSKSGHAWEHKNCNQGGFLQAPTPQCWELPGARREASWPALLLKQASRPFHSNTQLTPVGSSSKALAVGDDGSEAVNVDCSLLRSGCGG